MMSLPEKRNPSMFMLILIRSLGILKARTAVTFFSILIGAAIVTAFSSVYFDITIKMHRELRTYGANLFVVPKNTDNNPSIDQSALEKIAALFPKRNLVGSSPFLYGIVRLDLGNAVMAGVDFRGLRQLSPYWHVEGDWVSVGFDDKNCMVGKVLAEAMELKVGDEITVSNRETKFRKKLRIRGIIETGEGEDEQLFVNLALAQRIMGMPNAIHHAKLSLSTENLNINTLALRVNQKFPSIEARPLRKISFSEGIILDKIKGIMSLITIIILISTTFGVSTTLMAIVVERSKEIGLTKALGADNRSVIFQFLTETGLLAFFGALGGLMIGFLLAQIIGHSVFNSAIALRPAVIPLTLVSTIMLSLLAAAFPVNMAIKILPARVLKGV